VQLKLSGYSAPTLFGEIKMSSTKRLKHISMMLLWDDVEYIERELCQSHGDLSHIFRNVFHNFVTQMRATKAASEKTMSQVPKLSTVKSKKEKKVDSNSDNKDKTPKSKPNRPAKRKDSDSGRVARKGGK
jgi:hypothetical protein